MMKSELLRTPKTNSKFGAREKEGISSPRGGKKGEGRFSSHVDPRRPPTSATKARGEKEERAPVTFLRLGGKKRKKGSNRRPLTPIQGVLKKKERI